GDDVAPFSQNEIGTNHPWQIVSNFFPPRKLNQLFWFTGIEITRHPGGLFAFNAQVIELIAGALKNEEPMSELFQLGDEFFLDWKGIRREKPVLFRKKTFLRESRAYCIQSVLLNLHWHHSINVQRSTPDVQHRIQ